ncbi:MAG: YggS family pyridoxal phosphate-dependent enzyme [Oscillospiraceae bacterium]|nr:YggS family pyridoxal phosphate-dependent enzyme [Oscillospiraceae bacterium]
MNENYKLIINNINETKLKYNIKDEVRLMAVTKNVEPEMVNKALSLGIELLGENRVQEYLSKREKYTKKAEIHFIGGLQTNKVKYIIDKVDLIQSVDSLKLAAEIDRQAKKHSLSMDVLVEVNIANEQTKGGISGEYSVVEEFISTLNAFENLRVRGIMTIPPPMNSERYFERMNGLFQKLKAKFNADILSMGMSGDYQAAIKHGANIVRLGSALFRQNA